MIYSQAKQGRVFIIRLEDGDVIHEEIERFARTECIAAATLIALGAADKGSRIVVGPESGRAEQIIPMEHVLDNVHEIAGVGTIFLNESGEPVLHMHMAFGRQTSTVAGCVRKGVKVWHIMEIILLELVDTKAVRVLDQSTGFEFLQPM